MTIVKTKLLTQGQLRVDALTALSTPKEILKVAIETAGLPLNFINIETRLTNVIAVLTNDTSQNDVIAINAAKLILEKQTLEIGDYFETERTVLADGKRLLSVGTLIDATDYPLANARINASVKKIAESTYPAKNIMNYTRTTPRGAVNVIDTPVDATVYRWSPEAANNQPVFFSPDSYCDGGFFDAAFSADEQYQYFLFIDLNGRYLSMAKSDNYGASFTQARLGAGTGYTCSGNASIATMKLSVVCSADGQTVRVCNAGNDSAIFILESLDAGTAWALKYTTTFINGLGSGSITWGSKVTENDVCYIGSFYINQVHYPTLVIDIKELSEINLNNANKPTEVIEGTGLSRVSHDGNRVLYSDMGGRSFDFSASQSNHLIFYTDDYGATQWSRVGLDFNAMLTDGVATLQMTNLRFSSLHRDYAYATISQERKNNAITFYRTILVVINLVKGTWERISEIGNHERDSTASHESNDNVLQVDKSNISNTEYVTVSSENSGVLSRYTMSIDKFVPATPNNSKLVVDAA